MARIGPAGFDARAHTYSRATEFTSERFVGGSPFPRIADYAFISDCQANALIAPSGNVEWLCLPRPDSGSVFGAILDRSAGGFRIGPSEVSVPAGRRYLPGSMVLETAWRTPTGWCLVWDALCVGPWYHDDRAELHRRTPTDQDAEDMLVRTIQCVSGSVHLHLDCDPAFDFGRAQANWEYLGAGYGAARASAQGAECELRLTTDLRLGFEGRRASARTTLREGQTAFAALSWGRQEPPTDYADAAARIDRTAAFWREWLAEGSFPDHPWAPALERSAITLKGLTYSPTGAMLAAATTSLPEDPGGERNWDYRFSWVRDSTFMLWGLYSLGFNQEANDFFYFIADMCDNGDDLQVLYGVGGEKKLEEATLDHLTGHEFSRPVRIGNAAYQQRQHDVWGAFLDSLYLHTRSRDYLSDRMWRILEHHVEAAIACWAEPDRGIWEVRGEPRHFTSSKVMCWVAADRGARLAELYGNPERLGRWRTIADEIHADVCARAVNDEGVFTQHYGTRTALDASLLLLPLVRFLPPDDPRIRNTVLAIANRLTDHGLVKRYDLSESDDGVSGGEGTFTICSFWLVSALTEIGEVERARQLCERLLAYASPLGLYAEELDPTTGRQLGNFPQAFTHLALINAVLHVIRAEDHGLQSLSPWRTLQT
jgi:GH15 family glucan-1,4-alpha-glucosidase